MKVFLSWQSDTPGKTNRFFIRDALHAAIQALKQPEIIEEPSTREIKDALHLDQDRQGVSGSPDLAATIFKKIEETTVFVADVIGLFFAGSVPALRFCEHFGLSSFRTRFLERRFGVVPVSIPASL